MSECTSIYNYEMEGLTMGIDIGTSSVKICLLDNQNNKVVSEKSKETQSKIYAGPNVMDSCQQTVFYIIAALNACLSKFGGAVLQKVTRIGVCGQMHGVVLWSHKPKKAWKRVQKQGSSTQYEIINDQVSNLFTWQDQSCSPEFLDSLPVPDSHLQIYSGYGIPTIFWLKKERPQLIDKFDRAGTIQDFVVSMICDSEKNFISDQNAASWGYFNCQTKKFNVELLEDAGFPVNLLPEVKTTGEIVGALPESWYYIPEGTRVGVAMGDLQCSVLASVEEKTDAVLNISTSAQIAFLVNSKLEESELSGPPRTDRIYIPYINNTYLAVAASLNGGNSLDTFVTMLQNWFLRFGFNVPKEKIWDTLKKESENATSDMEVILRCKGERNNPNQRTSLSNIHAGNLGLGQVYKSLSEGIVRNLYSMMPKEILEEANVSRIVCSGSVVAKNKLVQNAIMELYEFPIKISYGSDAAIGAAMVMKPKEV